LRILASPFGPRSPIFRRNYLPNMKNLRFLVLALILVASSESFAQQPYEKHVTPGGVTYMTVPNDPLNARIYFLKNGLTVYMSVNKNEPRIQTMIAVRAGSKNDPADATGLAHYLEHLLFKGTDKYGSLDYSKEKPLLDQIEALYEKYRSTTDATARTAIYHQIDSVSGEASKFAIANEYDKMLTEMGAKGTNAHTSNEETVYVNDIPSNQIDKWLTVESERFRNPVIRLFHTELEAVYEEKNRTLDNDGRQVSETMLAALFAHHPYGTQTTIGTVEHLKNPSITKIKQFYNTYYVPNNMAIVLSGDFDPDVVIQSIDKKFGGFAEKRIANFTFEPESQIAQPIVREVYGPEPESIELAYRFPGMNTQEAQLLKMTDMVLSNSAAGLIDLNLNQDQKVLHATSGVWSLSDYSIHIFDGRPKEGQSLDDVKKLLLDQIDLLKKGQFDASLLPAIINDFTLNQIRRAESNGGRAQEMTDAFIHGKPWQDVVTEIDHLSNITKKDIVDFANKYYGDNYVVVYKRTGDRKNVAKVVKPAITPITVNRTAQSDFLKSVADMPVSNVAPRFVDYKTDIKQTKVNGLPMYYLHNAENELFSLYYVLDMGKKNDRDLAYALNYLDFLGTNTQSAADIKKKFFSLGSSFNVSASDDQAYVTLTGLQKNFRESVKLFEDLLANAKADPQALKDYVGRTIKGRRDMKKNRGSILNVAMVNWAKYGKTNPLTNDLSNEEMQKLSADDLVSRIHSLTSYDHHILYYGPATSEEVAAALKPLHKVPAKLKSYPTPVNYTFQDTKQNKVYFVDYDMAQAEVVMLSKGLSQYDPKNSPVVRLYNEYFGGGMSSVVFQSIRESKALAYAVFSTYQSGGKKDDPYYLSAYVGTQADKIPETMKSMFELLNEMPRADKLFEQAKSSIRNKIETERITRQNVLMQFESARRMGLDHDIRKDIYEQVPTMSYDQVSNFQQQNVKDHQYAILVLGSKKKVDMNELSKYGPVEELSLDQVFGF
jgi:predicted Zn-dependent peptidase